MKAILTIRIPLDTDNTTDTDYIGSEGPLKIGEDLMDNLVSLDALTKQYGVLVGEPTFVVTSDNAPDASAASEAPST